MLLCILPKRLTPNRVVTYNSLLCNCQRTVFNRKLDAFDQIGGGERDRTDDPLRARQVLSQLSYAPDKLGGPRRTRTSDLTIISRVL